MLPTCSKINIQIVSNKQLCILIISHGRHDNVVTLSTLKKCKSTIPTYIVVDDLDKTKEDYIRAFGSQVVVFDKAEIAKKVDNGDNFSNLRTTTHARNACFDIAKHLGFKYFLVLDDDYTRFEFRINSSMGYEKRTPTVASAFDRIVLHHLDFFKSIPSAVSICLAQGGDFIGGSNSGFVKNGMQMKRKAMNSFFCSTDRPFQFISRLNEDVNTYLSLGSRGSLFATIPFVSVKQVATQSNKGGMTEAYIDGGTYVKSFYTVMYCPSFTKVTMMNTENSRLHYSVNWANAVPVILSEDHKKK